MESPQTIGQTQDKSGGRLLPRNMPNVWADALARPLAYMPQNAWAWCGPSGTLWARRALLRTVSNRLIQRCDLLVRLSSAIPSPSREVPELLLPNVLDAQFEVELSQIEVPDRPPFIFVPGSIVAYRNVETLMTAFARTDFDLEMVVAGPVLDPRYLRRLQTQAASDRRVIIEVRGFDRKAVLGHMRASELVVFPSLVEASAVTTLEALAIGSRIVLSDIPGHTETAGTEIGYCHVFNPLDVDGLVSALGVALACSPERTAMQSASTRSDRLETWCAELTKFLERAV